MKTQLAKPSSRFPNTSILFVDDDLMTRELMTKYLSNWDVQTASSAVEALEKLNSENYQIIIVDINMPGINGIELLKEVKETRPLTQAIVSTASYDVDHLISALEAGACDFLLKPLNKEDIEEALERIISKLDRWKTQMKALMKMKRAVADK